MTMRPNDEGREQQDRVPCSSPNSLPLMVTAWRNKEVSVAVTRALAEHGRDATDCVSEVRTEVLHSEVGVEEAEVDG